ncbi:MAG: MBL fold metallo-hydrolase [Thermomicrobiales bacterium]
MADRVHRFNVGSFRCVVVCDQEHDTTGGPPRAFLNATPEESGAAAAAYADVTGDAASSISMNILVVDTGTHLVIVDTGNGPSDSSPRGGMLDGLAAAGIEPASVDVVITTHAHPDHVAGNTDGEGHPTFPNARYVISGVEWQRLAEQPNEWSQTQLSAIADRYERITPGEDVVPGIATIPTPGHAPGQMALLIEDGGEQLLHIADVFHVPFQPAHPDWYLGFDADPEQTVLTRRALLERAAREGYLVIAYHTPFPGLGRIRTADDVWQWWPER